MLNKKRPRSAAYRKKCLKAIQKELFNAIVNFQSSETKVTVSILLCLACCMLIVILIITLIQGPKPVYPVHSIHDLNKLSRTLTINLTSDTSTTTMHIETEEPTTNLQKILRSAHDIVISINTDRKQSNTHRVISLERATQIKSAFKFAWHSYAEHALGHDGLSPVDGTANDVWGAMGATLIDALDTMILMGLYKEYKVAIDTLQSIDFNKDLKVSFFETTIRHLGGLIGAYTMNQIMLQNLVEYSMFNASELQQYENIILSKATGLANNLLNAFSTSSGIPKSMVNLKTGKIENYGWTSGNSVLAEIGSNQLEFYALSQYNKDAKYYTKSVNVYKLLNENHSQGLFPRLIDPVTIRLTGKQTLGGMSDSFYEYLLKLWILTGYENKLAIQMYVQSISHANEKKLKMVYDANRREKAYYFYGDGEMEELVCFMPGVLALGSYHAMLRKKHSMKYDIPLTEYEEKLFEDRHRHLKLAHVLVESCYSLFNEMATGLAPESIRFNKHSWSVSQTKYQLRPETVESLFILYSLTGNEEYKEWGWNIFRAIETECKTNYAYSGVVDVTTKNGRKDNQMQSFFFAETLKYLYLLFDSNAAGLVPLNQYVFNTEAHLIRIQKNETKYESSNDSMMINKLKM